MSWSTKSAIGLAAALLMAGAAVPGQAGPGSIWTPEQGLWSTASSSRNDVGMAVSGNGTTAVVMSAGRAAMWNGTQWGASKKIPKARFAMYLPEPHMSWNGKRVLATWSGDAEEGVDHLYRSTKVGKKGWKSQEYGLGEGASALSDDGALGVVGWYETWPDDGLPTEMYVSTWTGNSWSVTQDLTLPGMGLDGSHPVVAVADGGSAVAAWSQGGRFRASFFDDAWGGWSPAIVGSADQLPVAAGMDPVTGNAELVTARESGVDQWTLRRVTVTPAGNVITLMIPIAVITTGSLYNVHVELADDGDAALISYVDQSVEPVRHLVGTWTAGGAWETQDVGPVHMSAALARDGGAALVTTMSDSNVAGSTPAVRVSRWDGTSWSAAKKVGKCQDKQVASALSPSGATMVAGWTCSHLHAVRSPKPPSVIKKLSATTAGTWAKLRWKAAKNADSYEYKVKGRNAPHGWQSTVKTRAKVRIAPGARYRVMVRGVNVGGPGPKATVRFS